MSTTTYTRSLVFILLTGILSLVNNVGSIAQGCNQVDVKYEEPDCYKKRGGGATGGPSNSPCLQISACEDQLYTYSATGGPWASYLWTITSGPATPAISPNATSATAGIIWPVQGIYTLTITVTDAGGNSFTKCIEVTVKERPIAGFTFFPVSPCANSTVNFTNTTSFSGTAFYSWNFGDPSSAPYNTSTATNPSHFYGAPGTYTVTLIAYSSALVPTSPDLHGDSLTLVTCCADTIKKTITILPGTVKIECISTVCAGTKAKYTAVGCTSPTWGAPVGGTIVSTSGNTVTVQWGNGNPQGQLSVTCGSCTTYATVPIIPTTPVIVGSTAPCNSGASTYSVPYLPGTYYTWTLTDVTTATNVSNLINTYPDNNVALINWSLATPGDTYQLTINLNNLHLCCSSTGSLTIIPKGRFAVFGPPSICAGQTTSFFPSPSGTFNWSVTPTAGVSPTSATGTSSFSATFLNAGNYVITAANVSSAFCNDSASVSLSVVPVPTPGSIQGPLTGCAGSQYAYNMSSTAPPGYYYEWTVANGTFQPGGGTTTTGDNVNIQWSALSGTITVVLKQSAAPFCSVPAGNITVNNSTIGAVSGPINVCVDGTGTYTLSGGNLAPGTIITWSITPSSLGTIISGQGSNSITILWHGQGGPGPWGPATVSASTGCGLATPLGNITIFPKFTVNITAAGTDVCQGTGMALTANGAPLGATFVWTPGGAITQTISGITVPGTYSVTATAGGCSASAQFLVPDPFAIIPVTCGVGICNGTATNEQLGVQVIKPAVGTFTYEWHSGTCTSLGPILATSTSGALSNSFTAPADGNYCVVVKYGNCQKCVNFVVKKVCCPDVNTPVITNNTQITCNQYSFTGTTPNPAGATITWNFGDGVTAAGTSGVAITHTYANAGIYCVTFCVGPPSPNPTSCTGNCAATQAVVPITASFTRKIGCNGCVSVTNTSAIFGNPAFVTYAWNFGDAFTSTLQNPPQHCYATGGTYVITLTVTYNSGSITCTKVATDTVVYTPLAITNNAPVCTGVPVAFASNPGGFVFYTWTFGDGFTGYSSPIQHAYTTAGPYTANLSVVDALGNTCTASTSFNVQQGINTCVILPGYICSGNAATLIGPAGTYTYLWEVETIPNTFVPAPGTNNGATYTTTIAGNYHVVSTNANGCKCTSNTVAVTPVARPKASFTISPSINLCSAGVVSLAAPFITGYTYDWFLNGSYGSPVSSGANYITFISSTTTFNLIVTNQYGCKDTCSMTVNVNTPPSPPTISKSGSCAGVPISLLVTNYTSDIKWNTGATTPGTIVFGAGTYIATYTDPATGCSSSSSVTINRRPSAGLFPHSCDSIPCKCSRPFVLYAPNPLVGLFASMYQINWYNANTNALLASGSSYNNGGLGVQTGSYYIVITDQTTGCVDTSNSYSIVVPPCDTCSCAQSSWGEIVLDPANSPPSQNIIAMCGKSYTLECNKSYALTAFYNCKDATCPPKVTYSLQPPTGPAITGNVAANITPTQNGNYKLTLYGWCGGKICDSCVIRFNVICICDCKGSKWGNIVLTQPIPAADPTASAVITNPQTLSCNKTYALECSKPYTISASFICKDTNCKGKVTYSLLPPVGVVITGNAPVNFTPIQTGTYILTLYGWCGDAICDSCVIKFTVVCGCSCTGSKWGPLVLSQAIVGDNPTAAAVNPTQTLACNKTYKLDCQTSYSFNASYFCKDSTCNGNVTYTLKPPVGATISGTAPFTFTPNLTGTYVLTVYGWCGKTICDSCVIKFDVNCECECKGSKWIEKTLYDGTTTTTLACKQYDWKCNLPFTINGTYNCAKPFCNSAATYKLIPAVGSTTTGNLPLTYTPTVSGIYKVVIYGWCGNQICDSCVSSYKLDCPRDTPCCRYLFDVTSGTISYAPSPSGNATIASQDFIVAGLGAVPLTEVRAEVLSFNLTGGFDNECLACKSFPFLWSSINTASAIGIVPPKISLYGGVTTPLFSPTGAAMYQNPREVVWNNGAPFTITSPITIKFLLPPPSLIDCCDLRGTICVKFTFRDGNCNECERIVCFDVKIKK